MELKYIDKNRNQFILQNGTLEYLPIRKNESSSGSYGGGKYKLISVNDSLSNELRELIESHMPLNETRLQTKGTSEISTGGKRYFLRYNSKPQNEILKFLHKILESKNSQLDHDSFIARAHGKEIKILFDSVSSPENIGMAFRVADSFNVKELIFSNCNFDSIDKKIERISRQTSKYISWKKTKDPIPFIEAAVLEKYLVIGIELTNLSLDIDRFKFSKHQKILLTFGSEQAGISQEILDVLNTTLHIPMYGRNSSMNVIQAMGIALSKSIS